MDGYRNADIRAARTQGQRLPAALARQAQEQSGDGHEERCAHTRRGGERSTEDTGRSLS